jgi:hypothetical protein
MAGAFARKDAGVNAAEPFTAADVADVLEQASPVRPRAPERAGRPDSDDDARWELPEQAPPEGHAPPGPDPWLDDGPAGEEPEWGGLHVLPVEPAAAKPVLRFRTAAEIGATVAEQLEWPARPWLCCGAITEMAGRVKASGKTTFVLEMVRCIVEGTPFMGEPTLTGPVVILSEQPAASLRIALARARLLERPDVAIASWADATGVPWPAIVEAAVAECATLGARVLIVDTLGQFARLKGDSENDSGAAMEAIAPLQAAANAGLAVFLNRHERKGGGEVGESARGSSAFAGAVDIVLRLSRDKDLLRPKTMRRIDALSRFDETPDELIVELTDEGYVAVGEEDGVKRSALAMRIMVLLPEAPAGVAIKALVEALLEERIGLSRALQDLVASGEVVRMGEGKAHHPYLFGKAQPSLSEQPTSPVHTDMASNHASLSEQPRTYGTDTASRQGSAPWFEASPGQPGAVSPASLSEQPPSRRDDQTDVDEDLAERAGDDEAEGGA